ncbi:MAG: hypothetical protein QOC63_5423 [Mycobacterium sp.]|nr:hypothetical protein [Mycobacterium sp.]
MQRTYLSTSQLLTILEGATGLSGEVHKGGGVISPRGRPLLPAAGIKFPEDQVLAVDRVAMWVDGGNIYLCMWPAEVQTQYTRFYPTPKKVEAVIALADYEGWEVNSNFHIAYWHAQPAHRWYPHLGEPEYVRQWVVDFRRGRAGARSRQEVEDPSFGRWLVERGYATESELPTLDDWLNNHPTIEQFFIRPGVQVLRTWPLADPVGQVRWRVFVAEVREAIDRVLSALDEPKLSVLQPHNRVKKAQAKLDEPPKVCPTCFMVLPVTGICDNCV